LLDQRSKAASAKLSNTADPEVRLWDNQLVNVNNHFSSSSVSSPPWSSGTDERRLQYKLRDMDRIRQAGLSILRQDRIEERKREK